MRIVVRGAAAAAAAAEERDGRPRLRAGGLMTILPEERGVGMMLISIAEVHAGYEEKLRMYARVGPDSGGRGSRSREVTRSLIDTRAREDGDIDISTIFANTTSAT